MFDPSTLFKDPTADDPIKKPVVPGNAETVGTATGVDPITAAGAYAASKTGINPNIAKAAGVSASGVDPLTVAPQYAAYKNLGSVNNMFSGEPIKLPTISSEAGTNILKNDAIGTTLPGVAGALPAVATALPDPITSGIIYGVAKNTPSMVDIRDKVGDLANQAKGIFGNIGAGNNTNAPGAMDVHNSAVSDQTIADTMNAKADAAQTRAAPAPLPMPTIAPAAQVASAQQATGGIQAIDPSKVALAQAAAINPTGEGTAFQSGLMAQLANQASGGGPSPADLMFGANTEANINALKAANAGNRGMNANLAQRQIGNQAAGLMQQTAQQGAVQRAQEILSAQQQLAGVSGTAAGQDIGLAEARAGNQQAASSQNAGAANALTTAQSQINADVSKANAGAVNDISKYNASNVQQNNQYGTTTTQGQQQFNTGTILANQKMNDDLTAKYLAAGMSYHDAQLKAYTDIMNAQTDLKKQNNSPGMLGAVGQMAGGVGSALAGVASMFG